MCLETSKQAYTFLRSLSDAGSVGLSFGELVQNMTDVSLSEFGTDSYVMAPVSLMSILRKQEEIEGIEPNGSGGFRLTNAGAVTLNIVNQVAILPRRSRLAETG